MAVTYATSLKTTRMTDVVNAIDAGAGPGTLTIGTTGMATTLCVLTFSDPCGTVSGDTLTFSGMPKSNTASASGTAAEAVIKDSSGNTIISGLTVSTSGANINLSATSITIGQTVQITSGTIVHG